MKSWLITVSPPICGTEQYFCAFCDGDPLNEKDFPYNEITNDLWENYSYLLHLEDEEYESKEEEQEVYDQAYEDWQYDCSFSSEEMSLKDICDYLPDGAKLSEYLIYGNDSIDS